MRTIVGTARALKVALDRLQVSRVVVLDQQLLDHAVPVVIACERLPLRDLLATVQCCQAIELTYQRIGIALEVLVLVAKQPDACLQRNVERHALRRAHQSEQQLVRDLQLSDLSALGLDENRCASGRNERSADQISVSNSFCDGCGCEGRPPSTEPR